MHHRYEVILFDLGGVLVELQGQPVRNEWLPDAESHEQNWARWLRSPAAQAFEKGQLDAPAFAGALIEEMALQVDAATFIEHFTYWPKGLYPGTLELLEQLSARAPQLALFSNINELHWPRVLHEMALAGCFDHYFASHLIGRAKPDPEAFAYVAAAMDIAPGRILFLDDNRLNVDGARQAGLVAHQVQGLAEVTALLQQEGLL